MASVEERSSDKCVVKFSMRLKGERYEWSQTCKPIDKRTARQIADDFANRVDKRLEWIRSGEMTIPPEALTSSEALRAFVMNVDYVPPPKTKEGTIQTLVDDYLEARRLTVETSEGDEKLSIDSYTSDRQRLNQFLDYCKTKGKSSLSAVVSADFTEEYRNHQLGLVAERKRRGKPHGTGAGNAHHRLRTVKALLLWADRKEKIDRIPKNVKDGEYAKVPTAKPKPQFFTVKQVEQLYKVANEQQRLWILLALNCGYLQNDIATLAHDMVDWKTGIIKRDRQKTGVSAEHKLWPITLQKLREQAKAPDESPVLLLNSKGNPLTQKEIDEEGKGKTVDTVVQSFRKLKTAAKLKAALSFKHFRKTGANAIEQQFQDKPWLASLYLAHDIAGPIRSFYTGQSFDALHEATDWLAQYFGFNDGGTLSGIGGSNSQ